MLISLLYHSINKEKYSTSLSNLEKQFLFFSKKYKTLFPGEKLSLFKTNLCITFDDAYFDFYYYCFPLLKKYKLKALLSVPVKFILDSTKIDSKSRLAVPYSKAMKGNIYKEKAPFCTWEELKIMQDSGFVEISNHSYSHQNFLNKNIDYKKEILTSKSILEEKLQKEITCFVYPLGKFNNNIHNFVKKHYKYIFRIGSCFNFSWNNIHKIIYRVISDNLTDEKKHFRLHKYISYAWFYLLNNIRGR